MPSGTSAFFYDTCKSTNATAVAEGIKGISSPTWFIAGEQTAGKGRRGREWKSIQGNLYCSYLFRPKELNSILTVLPFIVSLAIRDMLLAQGCSSETVKCKWPNDVLLDEQKISGVLIETSAVSNKPPSFIVIGIGINLADSPSDTVFPATSVAQVLEKNIETAASFKTLAFALDHRLSQWSHRNASKTIEEWSRHAWGIGTKRQINLHNESFHATLIGLETDGALKLKMDDGIIKRIYAGDVFGLAST